MTIAADLTELQCAQRVERLGMFQDRQLWLAILISAIVLLGRSWMITSAQSERIDDEYHIQRGVMFLDRTLANQTKFKLNDPPLGEAIGILPLWIAGNWAGHQTNPPSFIWGQKYSADTILNVIGLWKSFLLLPMMGLIFYWVRKLYGIRSAWLATGMVLIEPTIAAHTPLPSLDVVGLEAIVISVYLLWRYFERPTIVRLIIASILIAVSLLIKHTAIVLPIVAVCFAILWWVIKPWSQGHLAESWTGLEVWRRLRDCAIVIGSTALSIWALLMFDISRVFPPPVEVAPFRRVYPIVGDVTKLQLPAGLYICSFLQAKWHDDRGHPGFLLGKQTRKGWWYYFPVVSTYKVPIALGVLIVVGLFSVFWLTPRWDEWALFVPMLLLAGLMLISHINIGWRHFMPAQLFMMLIASRMVLVKLKPALIATWALVGIAWVDTLRYHPDYISYITYPRQQGWMAVSDSNVDWGQGLKYIKKWIDKQGSRLDGKKIYVSSYAWGPRTEYVKGRLGNRVEVLSRAPSLPSRGIIIISTVGITGMYETHDWYRALRKHQPLGELGHAMLVYDLDKLRPKGKPFDWGPPPPGVKKKRPAAKPATRPTTMSTSSTNPTEPK